MKAIIYCDGGARQTNPGHSAFSCIIKINGEENSIARYIGWQTNNVAEYYGIIVGVKYSKFLGATDITIFTDSQLVCNHINGKWKVKQAELRPFANEAVKFLDKFDNWEIIWIKRDKNQKADALCTAAIYAGMHRNPFFKRNGNKKAAEIDPFDGRATMNMMMPDGSNRKSHAHILLNSINKTK